MNKVLVFIIGLLFALPGWADNLEPMLNKVSLDLHSERWVTTDTGLVTVRVNAAVNNQGIDKLQMDVMQKLNLLSNRGEWHVVSFDRQLDNTGLESIQIVAQARLPQSELAQLRTKAKNISKPGVTFVIDDIQFSPSEDEMQQAKVALRADIYQQAKAEIDMLNKAYPDQKFYIHTVDFTQPNPIAPMPMMQNQVMLAKVAVRPEPLNIGNKVTMDARVIVTSMPDAVARA